MEWLTYGVSFKIVAKHISFKKKILIVKSLERKIIINKSIKLTIIIKKWNYLYH